MDLNRQKKGKLANTAVAILALGFASVFFTVGMIGGFNVATLVGVAIAALFVFGSVCAAVRIVFTLVTRGTALLRDNRSMMRSGEWWRSSAQARRINRTLHFKTSRRTEAFTTGGSSSSPAIGGDGTIYIGIDEMALYAVASPTVITVNTLSDSSPSGDGLCSLREVLTAVVGPHLPPKGVLPPIARDGGP